PARWRVPARRLGGRSGTRLAPWPRSAAAYAPLPAPGGHADPMAAMPDSSASTVLVLLLSSLWADKQSALHPRGHHAALSAEIGWVMLLAGAAIFVVVMVLLALALYGPARLRLRLSGRGLVLGAGLAFPVVALSALLIYSLGIAAAMLRGDAPAAARI